MRGCGSPQPAGLGWADFWRQGSLQDLPHKTLPTHKYPTVPPPVKFLYNSIIETPGRLTLYSKMFLDRQKMVDEAFTHYDVNHDGKLDVFEFKWALEAIGFNDETRDIKHKIRVWGDGTHITRDQFKAVITEILQNHDHSKDIDKAFAYFDHMNRGKILFEDLKKRSFELKLRYTEAELHSMIDDFDSDGDGYLTKEEFARIFDRIIVDGDTFY